MNALRFISLASIASFALACHDDSGKKHCDPDVPGTICTIAGSGENGYDKDADTDRLAALETEFARQPRLCCSPFALDGGWRNLEHTRRLFDRESAEGAKFDHAREAFIERCQAVQRMIQSEN